MATMDGSQRARRKRNVHNGNERMEIDAMLLRMMNGW